MFVDSPEYFRACLFHLKARLFPARCGGQAGRCSSAPRWLGFAPGPRRPDRQHLTLTVFFPPGRLFREVVGIVGDVKLDSLDETRPAGPF